MGWKETQEDAERERRRQEERRREAERNAIRAEIRRMEGHREELLTEIALLQQKIENQQQSQADFGNLIENYEDGKQVMQAKLEHISVHERYIKMLPGHQAMLGERVHGGIAGINRQRLNDMHLRMSAELEKNIRELEELNRQLLHCNQQISNLYSRLGRI